MTRKHKIIIEILPDVDMILRDTPVENGGKVRHENRIDRSTSGPSASNHGEHADIVELDGEDLWA
jgi:hypothetical protein